MHSSTSPLQIMYYRAVPKNMFKEHQSKSTVMQTITFQQTNTQCLFILNTVTALSLHLFSSLFTGLNKMPQILIRKPYWLLYCIINNLRQRICLWYVADESSLAKNNKSAVHDGSLHSYPAAQLLDKADEYVNSLDYNLARKFCQQALDAEQENTRALETLGFVELQSGDYEQARHVFFSYSRHCSAICTTSIMMLECCSYWC